MFLIMQVLWKSFYINDGFKISILLRKPSSKSYVMRCPFPDLCVDGWCYISALSLEQGKDWLEFFLCIGIPWVGGVNQPTQMQNPSNWWNVYKEGKFQVISWCCKECSLQGEIHLSERSYGIFAYQETRSIHAQFFYNRSRFRHSKLRWEKRQDYYSSMKLDICKQANYISVL